MPSLRPSAHKKARCPSGGVKRARACDSRRGEWQSASAMDFCSTSIKPLAVSILGILSTHNPARK
jgi:hypothetical protein